ncbi:MAG: SH3 domain-containing protein [Clostridia bacterium]|nr:SH3 domain-containing protein [Clostridia bacterium]
MALTKKLAALLLVLLALLPVPWVLADSGVVSGTTVSGTVRVYLSSIASNTSVDVTVNGSYSIGGDTDRAIARGTQLTVSNSGGTLLMRMNGSSQTMGSRFKLRRHQSSGENGVRIAQARKPQSLYPGDIEFIAKGGNVQIIVHVYMEDYMRGVLPYEMDNSFPLEALKAQAVAARTYALKKMSAQAATYDVVDTTSDQVYNGTPSGNERCVQAVQETSGIVGTVNGEYMASYYTASNGGQTESVANAWGSGSYSYLQLRDDPYDLRNSASIAKSVTFYRGGTTSISALTELLRTEAAAKVGASSVRITGITHVYPHSPKYDEPSRVYKKVDVGLVLEGYGQVTVTLDYFNQIESLCAMSINVLKNETLAVTETADGFKLTARRYGHGVGMSQRGAQQMAKEGLSYDQILEFYYPGLVRTRYTMTRTILPSIDGTVGSVDEPVSDARSAVVTLSNPLDSLNLRSEPSTTSSILATMAHGTQVTLLEMGSAWSRIQYGTLSGYVSNSYISVQDDTVDETPQGVISRGTAVVSLSDESQTLNLRAAPTVNSAVLSHLRHGQTLTVLERYERWTYVQMGSLSGYVSNDYIQYEAAGTQTQAPQQTVQPTSAPLHEKRTAIVLPEGGLNLRMGASRDSGVILTLPQGTMLSVTGTEMGGMLPVMLGGLTGYVASEYVFAATDAQLGLVSATPAPTATPVPTQAPWQGLAIVTARSGLKLREQADTASRTITAMPVGATVTVTGAQVNGFYPVSYGGLSGYASASYLSLEQQTQGYIPTPAATAAPTPMPTAAPTQVPPPSQVITGRTATVIAASGLNMRADSSTYADVVATLAYGVEVVVTGESIAGFYPVRVGTLSGYVSADYLRFGETIVQQAATPEPTAAPQPGTYRVVVDSENGLNLRAAPYTGSQVVYVLPYGMVLTVLGEGENGFLHVQWAGYTGYVSREYVTPFGAQ